MHSCGSVHCALTQYRTHGYNQPFAVTYASTASFILYLLPFVVMHANGGDRLRTRAHGESQHWWEALGFRLPPSRGSQAYVPHIPLIR